VNQADIPAILDQRQCAEDLNAALAAVVGLMLINVSMRLK
jgi:hypothetical protein